MIIYVYLRNLYHFSVVKKPIVVDQHIFGLEMSLTAANRDTVQSEHAKEVGVPPWFNGQRGQCFGEYQWFHKIGGKIGGTSMKIHEQIHR